MDTLETEEGEKKRKVDEVSEGKEIIDALERSGAKNDEKDKKVSAENHGFSRNTAPRDELIYCENERRRRRKIQAIQ